MPAKEVWLDCVKSSKEASTVSSLFITPTTVNVVAETRFRKPKPVNEMPKPTAHDRKTATVAYYERDNEGKRDMLVRALAAYGVGWDDGAPTFSGAIKVGACQAWAKHVAAVVAAPAFAVALFPRRPAAGSRRS